MRNSFLINLKNPEYFYKELGKYLLTTNVVIYGIKFTRTEINF